MIEDPEWMSLPVEMWDDVEMLKWLREYRGEPPFNPPSLSVEDFLLWLKQTHPKTLDVRRQVKYLLNEYYKEMRRADKP